MPFKKINLNCLGLLNCTGWDKCLIIVYSMLKSESTLALAHEISLISLIIAKLTLGGASKSKIQDVISIPYFIRIIATVRKSAWI